MTVKVFVNGNLFDGVRHRRDRGVAVRDGRVLAVGDVEEVREAAGTVDEEIDLDGGLLTPGFQDAHVHPMIGGLEQMRCDLSDCSSREEYLEAIERYTREHPGTGWLRGGGWSLADFADEAPTIEAIDRIVPDRPVFLPSNDHHDAWVNSRALEVAGIDEHTPDPLTAGSSAARVVASRGPCARRRWRSWATT